MGRVAGTVVVLLLAAVAARAAGEVRYHTPAGWTKAALPDGRVAFQPAKLPAGKGVSVMFLPPAEGDMGRHFDETWRRTTGDVKVVSAGKTVGGKTTSGLPTRSVTAVVEAGGQRTWIHFFAVQADLRIEMVLYAANDGELFEKHLPEVEGMLDSIRLAGAPEAPAPVAKKKPTKREAGAGKKGPGFDGVFYTAKVAFNAAGAPGSRGLKTDYLCFSSDGHVFLGTPVGGPVEIFENPPDSPWFGTYTLDGDKITVRWGHDKVLNQRLTHEGRRLPSGKVELNGETYHAIPACDDLKLDGTYSWKWGGGESTIRFTPDGRFTERGLRETVSDDDLVHPDWPKMPRGGAGTYTIRHNTLEIAYDGGPTRRIFFSTRDDPKDVKSVTINTYPHERR